jgi:Spy/CpxP family protein refolding chaperone
MNVTVAGWLIALLVSGLGAAHAQMPGPPARGVGPPVFLDQLFVPELIMRYQEDIKLTPEQRHAITDAMAETQKQLVDLQWQYESASKKLTDTLRGPNIDERAALDEADRLMNLELQMKKTHLTLLIRIKKVLNASQQATLLDLRSKEPPRHGGPPPPP